VKRPAHRHTFVEDAAIVLGAAGALIVFVAQAAGVLP